MPDEQYRRKLLAELNGISTSINRLAKAIERSDRVHVPTLPELERARAAAYISGEPYGNTPPDLSSSEEDRSKQEDREKPAS